MPTALITGVTGYLGSHLADALLEIGYELMAFRRVGSSMARLHASKDAIDWCDLDSDGIEGAFSKKRRIDLVVHTATRYGRSSESIPDLFSANTEFPLHLLCAATDHGAGLFLNADTALERFTNPYAMSKNHFREWGRLIARERNIVFLNLKMQHFYGPGDAASKFTTHVIRSCLGNVPRLSLTDGLQKRDFIYIKDAVSACITALKWGLEQDPGGLEVEVGVGNAIRIKDLVMLIHRLCGSKTFLDFGALAYRENEPMFLQADTEVLQNLSWSAKYNLEEGLRETIAMESER